MMAMAVLVASLSMIMTMFHSMMMLVGMLRLLLAPEFFARKLLLAGDDNVHLGCADAATIDARNLQPGVHTEGFHSAREQLKRNSGVDQRTEKHIAADPGKAL
jgi:hypothetical protein